MRNLVGAPIAAEIAADALRVIEDIRAGRLTPRESHRVVAVIARMTEASMHHFFIVPSKAFGLGLTLSSIVEWGANSSVKVIGAGLKRVIPKLRDAQLRQLADFLDESLFDSGSLKK